VYRGPARGPYNRRFAMPATKSSAGYGRNADRTSCINPSTDDSPQGSFRATLLKNRNRLLQGVTANMGRRETLRLQMQIGPVTCCRGNRSPASPAAARSQLAAPRPPRLLHLLIITSLHRQSWRRLKFYMKGMMCRRSRVMKPGPRTSRALARTLPT